MWYVLDIFILKLSSILSLMVSDICHTQLFTGSSVCLCCGRDLCAACSNDLARVDVADSHLHYTCRVNAHPIWALQPVTFFEQIELRHVVAQMSELVPTPSPQVTLYFLRALIPHNS